MQSWGPGLPQLQLCLPPCSFHKEVSADQFPEYVREKEKDSNWGFAEEYQVGSDPESPHPSWRSEQEDRACFLLGPVFTLLSSPVITGGSTLGWHSQGSTLLSLPHSLP